MNDYPGGWDAARVRDLLACYESQTDEEAAVEHRAAVIDSTSSVDRTPRRDRPDGERDDGPSH